MSGGSLDYLYCKADGRSLLRSQSELREAQQYVADAGFADAAARFQEMRDKFEEALDMAQELSDMMHTVEWIMSCDYGREDMGEAVQRWRKERIKGQVERVLAKESSR